MPSSAHRAATKSRTATTRKTLRLDSDLVRMFDEAEARGEVGSLTRMVERWLREHFKVPTTKTLGPGEGWTCHPDPIGGAFWELWISDSRKQLCCVGNYRCKPATTVEDGETCYNPQTPHPAKRSYQGVEYPLLRRTPDA